MGRASSRTLRPLDVRQIEEHGLSVAEVERQLRLLRRPPPALRLDRPCRVGDGIVRLDAATFGALDDLYAEAVAAGRFTKMVPASGAATRMFHALATARAGSRSSEARDAVQRLVEGLERFAFGPRLIADRRSPVSAARPEEVRRLLDDLLGPDGLAYGEAPKALIPFHAYPDGPRTALEEQLREAAEHLCDRRGGCRLHFTVSPDHRATFEAVLSELAVRLERQLEITFRIGLSVQSSAMDTVAGEVDGGPFRDDDGRLVFRPGGHGALLPNLSGIGADLVHLKNIDNILPDHRRGTAVRWKRLLGGFLLQLEARSHSILQRLEGEAASPALRDEALRFCSGDLGWSAAGARPSPGADDVELLRRCLRRPLRVCGVVANRGEPGGGPFWVREADGMTSRQIVESAQIHREDPEQRTIAQQATHFNPVDLVLALRDHRGRPHDLDRFTEPNAVFVTRKSHQGRPLLALERPGLWNGAMARWTTVFVEVPAETFAPVKTIFDLLRPEHQP